MINRSTHCYDNVVCPSVTPCRAKSAAVVNDFYHSSKNINVRSSYSYNKVSTILRLVNGIQSACRRLHFNITRLSFTKCRIVLNSSNSCSVAVSIICISSHQSASIVLFIIMSLMQPMADIMLSVPRGGPLHGNNAVSHIAP